MGLIYPIRKPRPLGGDSIPTDLIARAGINAPPELSNGVYKPVKLIGPKAMRELTASMDTGASESFIRTEEAQQIATPYRMPEPMTLELGKGELKADEAIFTPFNSYNYVLRLNVCAS